MDHAINSLSTYYDLEIEDLAKEWASGKYKELTECPNYCTCDAYRRSLNVLYEHYYNKTIPSVSQQVKMNLEE